MRVEKIKDEELGLLRGNYWRLFGAEGVMLDRVALPAHIETAEQALTALIATYDELTYEGLPETIAAKQAIVDAQLAAKQALRDDDGVTQLRARLIAATPAEINTYVDQNVTTLAQLRVVLKALLKLAAADLREKDGH